MSTFAKITQLGFAGSLLFTSLYMSLGFNECDCDNARVYIPNQIVMIMGVLGVVFTVCNCGFDNTPFGHASNTLVPGMIGSICTIIMLTGDNQCKNCCDEEPCEEGTKKSCCVSKSKVLWAQLAISIVLAGWGSWAAIAQWTKNKAVKTAKETKKKVVKTANKARDNLAEYRKKQKLKKMKAKAEAEGDDYSFSELEID